MATNNYIERKLYALLISQGLTPREVIPALADLDRWWEDSGQIAQQLTDTSDCLYLQRRSALPTECVISHPISGEKQSLQPRIAPTAEAIDHLRQVWQTLQGQSNGLDRLEIFYWYCWRFLPDRLNPDSQHLLWPAHPYLPDRPEPSYSSAVAAMTGALFPDTASPGELETPYLLIFTFSPIQEFIKASRKLLDFWAGSYLLHYLSARLCWHIAQELGPDAVITPSLWGQEIIDAFLAQQHPELFSYAKQPTPGDTFNDDKSASRLSTAGFPNVITVLTSNQATAQALGQALQEKLLSIWQTEISHSVRKTIKEEVIKQLNNPQSRAKYEDQLSQRFQDDQFLRHELDQLAKSSCWEWNALWDAQISHSWESYYAAVPLGDPDRPLGIPNDDPQLEPWSTAQNAISLPRIDLPQAAERATYEQFNVGTWWGSCQGRLGQAIQALKNTRTWQIPAHPGERSSLLGQGSALHPRFLYRERFQEGRGVNSASLRLFWQLLAEIFPNLFNGTEKLNAIELTKRLAWHHGGVAESLGIQCQTNGGKTDYETLIRFPNASSIAAAQFASRFPKTVSRYQQTLGRLIREAGLDPNAYQAASRRPFQIPKTDRALQGEHNGRQSYNGVMFSAKWLGEAMNIGSNEDEIALKALRDCVAKAHQLTGFRENSPQDWWVLALGDGDSMGQYVNGSKLKPYKEYVLEDLITPGGAEEEWQALMATSKRMGPATHVSLNRALLDFSNRLVPYLTEERHGGRVIYSGGDDVLVALSLGELPDFLQSLRAAWCGGEDPKNEFENAGDYWQPKTAIAGLPQRPLFTMGQEATMSLGIVIAHKSVPLPTVLEALWTAEGDLAKKMLGSRQRQPPIPDKDGLCFRVIYSSGNQLQVLLKGHLLESWQGWMAIARQVDMSPILHRLAVELPQRTVIDTNLRLIHCATEWILGQRQGEEQKHPEVFQSFKEALLDWLDKWEDWAVEAQKTAQGLGTIALGASLEDLASLLRFSAFYISRYHLEQAWGEKEDE